MNIYIFYHYVTSVALLGPTSLDAGLSKIFNNSPGHAV
jgi:hypothetical protein